jgi:hypothetical protein
MLRLLISRFAIGTMLVLAGCQSSHFAAQVSQFHRLPRNGEGLTFMVAPADKAKNESLEFETYAQRIVAELQARNFSQADHLEKSELLVFVDYGTDSGTVETYAVPVYGYYPDEFHRMHGVTSEGKRFSAQVYESGGFVPLGYTERVRTLYRRNLRVEIVNTEEWRRGRTVKSYEGRVVSMGPENEIAMIMPLMIRALFLDFPGTSGATRTIVLDPDP